MRIISKGKKGSIQKILFSVHLQAINIDILTARSEILYKTNEIMTNKCCNFDVSV